MEVYAAASLAQKEILSECELLEVVNNGTFVAAQQEYTSATSGWEWLAKITRVKWGVYTSGSKLKLFPQDKAWVESLMINFDRVADEPNPPNVFYPIGTNPISIGFWGTPKDALTAKFTCVRAHYDSTDNISSSVNPLVPSDCDNLLIKGTLCKLLEFRRDFDGNSPITKAWSVLIKEFEAAKLTAKITRTINQSRVMEHHHRKRIN